MNDDLTSTIPRAASSRASCSGSLPSGEPSSKPVDELSKGTRLKSRSKLTITILPNTMWGRVRNQNYHLARLWSPLHVQGLSKRGSHGFRAIASPTRVQRAQVPFHLADIRRESKVLRHVRVILWWMVAVGHQPNPQIFMCLEFARLEDVLTDRLDILRCGRDVAALASRTVLYEDQVSVNDRKSA